MTLLKRNTKLFFNTKILFSLTILFTVATNVFLIFGIFQQKSLSVLKSTNTLSVFCLIFFSFLSYEFLYKSEKSSFKELLISTKFGMLKLYLSKFIVLTSIAMTNFILILIINIIDYYNGVPFHNCEIFTHIILNVILNVLLVSLVGIFIGMGVSAFLKKTWGYVILMLFSLLMSPLLRMVTDTIYMTSGINVSGFSDFFDICPPSMDHGIDYQFGYSVLPYRFWHIAFVVFAIMAILLFFISKRSEKTVKAIATLSALTCAVSFGLYIQPSSKLILGYSPNAVAHDVYYYVEKKAEQKIEQADFRVLQYDMDIDIKNLLKASVNIKIDKTNLENYKFTLYHGYKVTKITDQNNKELVFKQYSDYIEVSNPQKETITDLRFIYKGFSTRDISNTQAIRLLGSFPYYPHAGFHKVFKYNSIQQSCQAIVLPEPTLFNIKIKYPKTIYTNLEKNEDGVYSGTTTGVTIAAGFLTSKTYEGIEYVYPYLDSWRFNDKNFEEQTLKLLERRRQSDDFKKVIILSSIQSDQYEDNCVLTDHMITSDILGISDSYHDSFLSQDKIVVRQALRDYFKNKGWFAQSVNNKDYERSTKFSINHYRLVDKAIKEVGEQKAQEEIGKYISSLDDTRSVIQFFDELGKEATTDG